MEDVLERRRQGVNAELAALNTFDDVGKAQLSPFLLGRTVLRPRDNSGDRLAGPA